MDTKFYFVSPVEVVKVTKQNLEEVAEWCGGRVAQIESTRVPGRMDSYVWVPTPKATHLSSAFPNMYVTRRVVRTSKKELKITWAVFRRDFFEDNYYELPIDAVEATWGALQKKEEKGVDKLAKKFGVTKATVFTDGGILVAGEWQAQDVAINNESGSLLPKLEEVLKEGRETFVHYHAIREKCSERDCNIYRFAKGQHYFEDVVTFETENATAYMDRKTGMALASSFVIASIGSEVEAAINNLAPLGAEILGDDLPAKTS